MATALMGQRHHRGDCFDFKNHGEPPTASMERRRPYYAPFRVQWTHGMRIYKRPGTLKFPAPGVNFILWNSPGHEGAGPGLQGRWARVGRRFLGPSVKDFHRS